MTVPLDVRNDIRSMDADGVPRAEIARRLRVSRNTVAKYAEMGDMSPAATRRSDAARARIGFSAVAGSSVAAGPIGRPRTHARNRPAPPAPGDTPGPEPPRAPPLPAARPPRRRSEPADTPAPEPPRTREHRPPHPRASLSSSSLREWTSSLV